jgi:hypothetical protein
MLPRRGGQHTQISLTKKRGAGLLSLGIRETTTSRLLLSYLPLGEERDEEAAGVRRVRVYAHAVAQLCGVSAEC